MDGDGQTDLLTGSDNCCDREPGVYWFRRESNGRFTAQPKVRLKGGWGELFMPQFRAALADWNGDGHPEFVIALTGTSPALYREQRPWVLAPEIVERVAVVGSPDRIEHQPCLVDWDRDGRLDLVTFRYRERGPGNPSIPEVTWQRNVATAGDPRLGEPQVVLTLAESEIPVGLSGRLGW